MNQKTLKNFQVIGRCAKMQTLSWDEMIKRLDGVPYYIDFSQDFSRIQAGELISGDMYTIMSAILSPPEPPALPAKEGPHLSPSDWERAEKLARKMEKMERAEARSNKVPAKKAMKNFKKTLKALGIEN